MLFVINISETFEKCLNLPYEERSFDLVPNKQTARRDLQAFLILDKLDLLNSRNIIGSSEHDEIYLDVDLDTLSQNASDEDILNLVRCGIRYSDSFDCLVKFT